MTSSAVDKIRPPASRWALLTLGLLLSLAACGSNESGQLETSTSPPPAEDTTTTVLATSEPETTTTASDAAPVLWVTSYEDALGWEYEVSFQSAGTVLDSSPGECLEVPPPGLTNVELLMTVKNLVGDRSAPTPPIKFRSNVLNDGSVLPGASGFDHKIKASEHPEIYLEVFPNQPAVLSPCTIDVSALPQGLDMIPAGESLDFSVTIGPVLDSALADLTIGVRFFTEEGAWIDGTLTLAEGSGVVVDVVEG